MTSPDRVDERTEQEREVDRDAFERAIAFKRRESKARAKQIDTMLADRPWEDVAMFAAQSAQCCTLGLNPWATPPCRATLRDLDKPPGDTRGERRAAELLKRLRDAGLSAWEPFPLLALERVGALPANEKVNCAAPVQPFRR